MKKAGLLLSQREITNLMVLPWTHFGLLKSGVFDIDYLFTLAGLFNIAGSMANLKRKKELEGQFSSIQQVVARLIANEQLPNEDEVRQIAEAMVAADRYLSKQTKPDLAKVIAYVDRCIATGKALRPQNG